MQLALTVEAVQDMTEYVSQGDGFLMNDNDPTRPMVMYYHNLIMQYAEDVRQSRLPAPPGGRAVTRRRFCVSHGGLLK